MNDLLQRVQQARTQIHDHHTLTRSEIDQLLADVEAELTSAAVHRALKQMSYSETEAMQHLARECGDADEILLVASKLADRYGLSRSVIVNAVRKFESAGVIQSRSLGMKGTHIKGLIPGWQAEVLRAA